MDLMDWASITALLIFFGVGFLAGAWWRRRVGSSSTLQPFTADHITADHIEEMARYARGTGARLEALIAHMGYKFTYQVPQRIEGRWVVEPADVADVEELLSAPEEPTGLTA